MEKESITRERLRGPRKSPETRRENLAAYWLETSVPISDDGLIRATESLEDANKATNNHAASTNRDGQWPMGRILQECTDVEGLEVLETPGMVFRLADNDQSRALVNKLDYKVLPETTIESIVEVTKDLDNAQIKALASYILNLVDPTE